MERLFFYFLLFFVFTANGAVAQSGIKGRLVASADAVEAGEALTVGFRIDLPDGWHVYWKNAGDAGEPTVMTLSLPAGFEDSGRRWPTPEKIAVASLTEYGYKNTAWFFADVRAPGSLPGRLVEIAAKIDFLACGAECVPMSLSDTVLLGVGKGRPNHEITAEINMLSDKADASYQETPDGFVLRSDLPDKARKAYFFPEKGDTVDYSAEQRLEKRDGKAYLFLKKSEYFEKTDALSGELVFYDAFGKKISAKNVAASPSADPFPDFNGFSAGDFLAALFFAFSGGFLLNLMPCVFPVLSLKAFSVMKGAGSASARKRDAVLYTAGVLVSFAGIGLLMGALRAAGVEMGWGFQLQYPPFVAGLSLFLFFLGLLFSDVAAIGGSWTSAGAGRFVSPFGTGVLAVVAASPCAAPFMGVALGYALMNPLPVTVAVLSAMGAGLASPFLILGFCPAAGRLLPKPGAWLKTFRNFLAFPMYAASAWLVWVLTAQAGEAALAKVLTAAVVIAAATWFCGATAVRSRWKAVIAAAAFFVAARAVLPVRETRGIEWIPYDAAAVESFRAQGNPVFLKFSARWCLTCLVNDKTAFADAKTVKAFEDNAVAAFYGDWTNRDPVIGAAIGSFGRNGVPLYVYYPPKAEEPVILPQLLTAGKIISALSRRSTE